KNASEEPVRKPMEESDSPRSPLIGSISVDITNRSAMLSAYTRVSTRSTYQRRATPGSAEAAAFTMRAGSIACAKSKLHVSVYPDGSRAPPVFEVARLEGTIGVHIDDADQMIVGEVGAEHAERPPVGHVSDRSVQEYR